jgi:hypothetical protein
MKKCSRCGIEKSESEFYKNKGKKDDLRSECKLCYSIIRKEYEQTERAKEKHRECSRRYFKRHPERHNASQNKQMQKINVKLAHNLRMRLHVALRNISKSDHTLQLVGCSIEHLKEHLEKQFTEGMTWKNYGRGKDKWNIDHKIACANFDLADPEQQKRCFHYSNTQPMWGPENTRKGKSL